MPHSHSHDHHAEVEQLKQQSQDLVLELEKTQAQAEEYLNGWKRALADYDNYRKQSQERTQEIRQSEQTDILANILPLLDHLEESLLHIPDDLKETAWYQGLQHIVSLWQKSMTKYRIDKIEAIGMNFDPQIHEAVEIKEETGLPDQTIIGVVRNGYTFKNKLLRPAKVIVNKLINNGKE